ncbi:hypothetical protein WAF17_02700 [Bernardetia sp. ABR2-2B]|uniref:hypothetical protein n=1 Tax=Bernardetia sp. ABR2-2B TaxID=3127472 RepID=UPI0030D4DC57
MCCEKLERESSERNLNTHQLRECVASKFNLVGLQYAGAVIWRNKKIQIDQICCKQAEYLVNEGFPFLEKKEVVENENSTTDTGSSATVELSKSTRNSKKNKAK